MVLSGAGDGMNSGKLGDRTYKNKNLADKIFSKVSKVSAGAFHTCAVMKDASLWCWGWNQYGQLGDGTTKNKNFPVFVTFNVLDVAVGSFRTCAIKKLNRTLQCWRGN